MSGAMFFDDWAGVVRTLIVGTLAYAALVGMLRVSGKRTLAKMNAFDLIVTVALGSTLATITLSKDVALVEGAAALALLICLQFAITWLSVRSDTISQLVKAEPAMLLYEGHFLHDAMRRERVTEAEVLSAVRQQGVAAIEDAQAVVLETDGSFTCVRRSETKPPSALRGLHARVRSERSTPIVGRAPDATDVKG